MHLISKIGYHDILSIIMKIIMIIDSIKKSLSHNTNHMSCILLQEQWTPLHLAAHYNCHVEVVELLIKSGADINAVTNVS